jgi:glucose-1-phosphate thymidylyltransferase
MKCILLCAGYATRLFPLTENFPKALLEIEEGKPLLDYILEEVNTIEKVDEVFVITNNRYYNHFLEWSSNKTGKPIVVINDNTNSNDDRLGAIGDINFVIDKMKVKDDLLIIAGDNLFNYPLVDVINYYDKVNNPVVCSKKIDNYELLKNFAVLKMDADNKIIELEEKPKEPKSDIAAYATYIYPSFVIPMIKNYLSEGNKPDAPGYLVEYLYKRLPFYAYVFKGECYDVGTHESLKEVREIYNLTK